MKYLVQDINDLDVDIATINNYNIAVIPISKFTGLQHDLVKFKIIFKVCRVHKCKESLKDIKYSDYTSIFINNQISFYDALIKAAKDAHSVDFKYISINYLLECDDLKASTLDYYNSSIEIDDISEDDIDIENTLFLNDFNKDEIINFITNYFINWEL